MSRAAALPILLVLLLTLAACGQNTTVTVDPQTRYQTILGWGKTTPWASVDPLLQQLVIDRCVNDFGINRLRFEGQCGNGQAGRSWEWLNDDDDPHHINWAGFNTARIDQRANAWVVPWKQAVEARGEPFEIYVSPSFFRGGSTGDVPSWLLNDPEEYAEWAEGMLLRLRDTHGLDTKWYSICNEAGNNNAFSPQVVAKMIRAVVPRFKAAGLPTRILFCESVNARTAARYIDQLKDQPGIWDAVGCLSYHWYAGDNLEWIPKIKEFADQRDLPTAQTEFMNLTIDHLWWDLTVGGTSYWELYGLCGPDFGAALSHVSSTTFRGGNWYWPFRQVSHYVRPGAVRIDAASTEDGLRALAFEQGGSTTLVLISGPGQPRPVTVDHLVPGTYGVSFSTNRNPPRELGPLEVRRDGKATVSLPGNTVLTLYPRTAENQPPVVTMWRTDPDWLALPKSNLALRVEAVDPDGDALATHWSVVGQPAGAAVALADAEKLTCPASGLTIPGEYRFAVAVSDGQHEVVRELSLKVFRDNQPPVPFDLHNRKPVWVTVKDGGTLLRCGGLDVEGDKLAYHWSVLEQPAGAAVTLATPDEGACQVTGMTVAGDYRFQVAVSDGHQTVTVEHLVPVYRTAAGP